MRKDSLATVEGNSKESNKEGMSVKQAGEGSKVEVGGGVGSKYPNTV
jgi:hypothetical protein